MSEMPEFKLIDAILTDDQHQALLTPSPESPDAIIALEQVDAKGVPGEFGLHMQDDDLGVRTAQLVALSLEHRGDVLLDEAADLLGYPTASEAHRERSARQAELLENLNSTDFLKTLTTKPGRAGSR